MSYYQKVSLVLFLSTISLCSCSQQMVQSPKDIYIICQNDSQFIGKPLKTLLNVIKPKIRLVLAEGGWIEKAPHFSFFFTSIDVYQKYRLQNNFPIHLTVYLKEIFIWNMKERIKDKTKDHFLDWTSEDQKKYGNLTITAIRVAGEYVACDYVNCENL